MSTKIRKTSRFMAGLLCLVVVGVFVTYGCEKDENGNRVTYYKTVGEGYVWDITNNKPIKGATITVESTYGSFLGAIYTKNTFTTDEKGYYKIRFIKKVYDGPLYGWCKVTAYWFEITDLGPMIPPPPPYWTRDYPSETFPDIAIYPSDIKDKKIITFDTVKYYQENF